MTNKLFISRCETILVTMRAKGFQSVRTADIAKWLEMESTSVGQFMTKLMKYNLLKKVGAASKTSYELSNECHNSYLAAINECNDVVKAAHRVVEHYINHKQTPIPVQEGKKSIDPRQKQAVEFLLDIIKENGDLKAENELLREEVTRLQEIEKKYNKITELIQIK